MPLMDSWTEMLEIRTSKNSWPLSANQWRLSNLLRIVFAFALEFPEFNRTKRARSFEKVQYFYFIFNSAREFLDSIHRRVCIIIIIIKRERETRLNKNNETRLLKLYKRETTRDIKIFYGRKKGMKFLFDENYKFRPFIFTKREEKLNF